MIKLYYYWCYRNSNPTPKKRQRQNNLILVKKKNTRSKHTSNYRTRNQKNYCNKFFARKKTWLCFI
ncbi:hypothetical protein [Spiroplasma poulsonii]|uniref:hypothetical protein n=1 Tax=Spiroplasma poulsonii TaxID=2138 RepID=UPI003A5C8160